MCYLWERITSSVGMENPLVEQDRLLVAEVCIVRHTLQLKKLGLQFLLAMLNLKLFMLVFNFVHSVVKWVKLRARRYFWEFSTHDLCLFLIHFELLLNVLIQPCWQGTFQ